MASKTEELEWRDGAVPVSTRFDDPYYSLDNGLAETQHVFLAGNQLPERFQDGFHVAELGFGTGLNLLATLQAWRAHEYKGTLLFTSFEAHPLPATDMIRAQAAFPDLQDVAETLRPCWQEGATSIDLPDLRFRLITGDARDEIATLAPAVDAWFLDGFSPAKNPELWEDRLLAQVGAKTAPGGTAATYTAAGHVRRALDAAGFDVDRVPGYGRKRHMTVARKRA